jgi:hypothetical protein
MRDGRIGRGGRAGQIAAKCVNHLTRATDRSEWSGAGAIQLLNPADDREISLARVWPVLFWTVGLGGALMAPAAGQNLDAGKPPSQIFSEVCANCHRSVRDFKSGVSSYFLREHYTTSADMASTMAAYLAGVRSDPRGPSSPQPKPSTPPATTTTAREPAPGIDNPRDPRRPQQTVDPKAAPTPPPGANRTRPGTARADASKPATAADAKPPVPTPPPLEEFEE